MIANSNRINLKQFLDFIARSFISAIFIRALPSKIFNFSYTVNYINSAGVPKFISPFLLVCAITCIIVGTFLFIFRKDSNLGAILLLIFLIPTTLTMNVFAFFNQGAITRNLAIIGGLILSLVRK